MRPPRSIASARPACRADLAWPWASPVAPSSPDTETLTVEEEVVEERIDSPWRVILFNDEIHTFDEVIVQLVKATGCSEAQAEGHAWTVHTRGKDTVYEGEFEDCFRVQGVLREIQLVTEIQG
ncbi:MAG: ATP-dependent Clp protease adaptor ClpS [Bacteroidota bacterium]